MLNKKSIEKLLEMPDDRLQSMIRILLAGTGIDVKNKKFDETTVRRIRSVLNEITDDDLERIEILMQRYRDGG